MTEAYSNNISSFDNEMMSRAIELAKKGLYTTTPNPRVGCVITKNKEIISEAWHVRAGEAHAEVNALNKISSAKGCCLYVTLEPCCHQGLTPACTTALVTAGIVRVVIAMRDPNPLVNGKGIEVLKQADIEVVEGIRKTEAAELNLGFISRMCKQRPWIRLKSAISIDGKIALKNGESQWITHQAARSDGHHWRAQACAVISGIGTILKDNAFLTVRHVETTRQPIRIILDSQLRTPINSNVIQNKSAATILVYAKANPKTIHTLEATGAQLMCCPDSNEQHIDIKKLLRRLALEYRIQEIHLETGASLSTAFIKENCVDELLLYLAPTFLGSDSMSMLKSLSIPSLAESHSQFRWHHATHVGEDLRLIARAIS